MTRQTRSSIHVGAIFVRAKLRQGDPRRDAAITRRFMRPIAARLPSKQSWVGRFGLRHGKDAKEIQLAIST
jgi:hypothetical protein